MLQIGQIHRPSWQPPSISPNCPIQGVTCNQEFAYKMVLENHLAILGGREEGRGVWEGELLMIMGLVAAEEGGGRRGRCVCGGVFTCNIIIYSHNNFKQMAFSASTLGENLFHEQHEAYSITLSSVFPTEIDNNEEAVFVDVLAASSLEEQLAALKRYHLGVAHVPEMRMLGDFHKNIEITMRLYDRTLLSQISHYTHEQKLDCSIHLLHTYRALMRDYGCFRLTHSHIRVDALNSYALWINEDYALNSPSLPLLHPAQQTEPFLVGEFVKVIRQFFTTDFFKYRKIQSFNQLEGYLEFIKRRNRIHKNCGNRAREESETRRRTTLSVRNLNPTQTAQKRHDRWARPACSFSTLLASNILSRASNILSRERHPNDSLINSSSCSRISLSKGSSDSKKPRSEVDTTIVSSELKNTRNISYLQLSNIIQKSQKKSCVFGSNPELLPEQAIKRSSLLPKNQSRRLNTHFCPIEYKRKAQKKMENAEPKKCKSSSIEKKNTLEIGLNSLLLSQINEDPENETGGSDLKRRQHLIEEFETLLCS